MGSFALNLIVVLSACYRRLVQNCFLSSYIIYCLSPRIPFPVSCGFPLWFSCALLWYATVFDFTLTYELAKEWILNVELNGTSRSIYTITASKTPVNNCLFSGVEDTALLYNMIAHLPEEGLLLPQLRASLRREVRAGESSTRELVGMDPVTQAQQKICKIPQRPRYIALFCGGKNISDIPK